MENNNEQLVLELTQKISELTAEIEQLRSEQKKQAESLSELALAVERSRKISVESCLNASEAVWAQTFNNAISGSEWLLDKSFTPGRWAAGYQFLYALYRVLNEFRPKSILELGLGQTTKLITQYVDSRDDVSHIVAEHDSSWVEFYKNTGRFSEKTELMKMEMITDGVYKDDNAVCAYRDFKSRFEGKKFDLISVDAPFGGSAKIYSRTDILSILPDCLEERFIIFVDDSNRKGEKNTVAEICSCLKNSGIEFSTGEYKGKKNTYIIASKGLSFFCSM